jgi:hypothetical protein
MGKTWGVVALVSVGCIKAVAPPPSAGYGEPYKGTGEQISVKDSRNDWDITEGTHRITSEQALEATGDAEYEARRQIAKDYNVRIYREGQAHRDRGNIMIGAGAGVTVIGLVLAGVVAKALQQTTTTPAMSGAPEMRSVTSGAATTITFDVGVAAVAIGVLGMSYGYLGGKQPPPYHFWRTPGPLDRPAYVRQQTEPYNDKLTSSAPPEDPHAKRPPATTRPPGHLPPMRRPR